MRLVVATHGHCFDGLASAVVFARLVSELESRRGGGTKLNIAYRSCGYGPLQTKPTEAVLDGDQNAILDYRYLASDRLTWFFDHHLTAFNTPHDRAHFEARRGEGCSFFFEPTYSSCTQLVSDVARKQFGIRDEKLDSLVQWADKIDAARFASAEEAISRDEPVMRLATVVEHQGDDTLLETLANELLRKPLLEVARSHRIEEAYAPLGQKHRELIRLVESNTRLKDGVALVDLTDHTLSSLGKFITYALFPKSVYSVVVGVIEGAVKISVGYNPWSGRPRTLDISQLCARYGGGGHPFVGGVSLAENEVDRARAIARQLAQELAG